MTDQTGYKQDTDGVFIAKDTLARLTYTMEWSEWLPQGVSIQTVSYSHNSRANDATPIVIHSSGIANTTQTYAVLSGGTLNRVYVITAAITLDNGQTDRRAFKIQVQNRLAQ
jgi:hypothetical protein